MECPACDEQFNGKLAKSRFNAHVKNNHPKFYREKVWPLKPRPSRRGKNRAAKLTAEEKEKAEKDKVMTRLNKKARSNQMLRIEFAAHPLQPYPARVSNANPFFVIQHELKIFIGITKADLLAFPVAETLKNYQVDPASEGAANKIELIAKALLALEETEVETLAANYHFYRKALVATEDYPGAISRYNKRTLVKSPVNEAAIEACLDEACVDAETEELYEEYLKDSAARAKKKELAPNTGLDGTPIESTASSDIDIGIGTDIETGRDNGNGPDIQNGVGIDSDPTLGPTIGASASFMVDPVPTGDGFNPSFPPEMVISGDLGIDNASDIGAELLNLDIPSPDGFLTLDLLQELNSPYPVYSSFEESQFHDPWDTRYMGDEPLQCEFTILPQ